MRVDLQKTLDKSLENSDALNNSTNKSDKILLNEILNVNKQGKISPKDIISQMTVTSGKQKSRRNIDTDDRGLIHNKRTDRHRNISSNQNLTVNIFGKSTLDIFLTCKTEAPSNYLKLWQEFENMETLQSISNPPSNQFRHLINLTTSGKLWKFPIDNEIHLKQEENFSQHVFLEEHLNWCEQKGPVRRFMDLVISGLSKNPYITVEEKLDHIQFFKNYFESRLSKQEKALMPEK